MLSVYLSIVFQVLISTWSTTVYACADGKSLVNAQNIKALHSYIIFVFFLIYLFYLKAKSVRWDNKYSWYSMSQKFPCGVCKLCTRFYMYCKDTILFCKKFMYMCLNHFTLDWQSEALLCFRYHRKESCTGKLCGCLKIWINVFDILHAGLLLDVWYARSQCFLFIALSYGALLTDMG